MNSLLNLALFVLAIALLCVAFLAVNIYVNKWSMTDLSRNLRALNEMALFEKRFANLAESVSESAQDSSESKTLWSNIFAKKEIPDFRYPTQELAIALDFSGANHTDFLTIKNLDSYKFFCLKEILKRNDIQFTYALNGKLATLEIALDSPKTRANLISDLKRYNISYTIN